MQTWSSVAVPRVPGESRPLRLYDTASGDIRPVSPGRIARMYVCGITPYDATHLGHAATYLAFDLVHRLWLDAGHEVHYVQNVTDIDDPLLERAERDQDDWVVLAMRETALFREDMEALRVVPPRDFIGAVETIPRIVEVIGKLLASGAAYRVDDPEYPDIYFDRSYTGRFGYESGYDAETMARFFAERGGDPERPGKRDPLDALLWRAQRPGEPYWESELGHGRPGWHIECSVIALDQLGVGFDVQGGGSDLAFPHHEYSAAHAEALAGDHPFARHYVHAGMIGLDGEKMSKSKGNLVFVSRLRAADVEPAAIRLGLFAGHYRDDRAWTDEVLATAQQRLARWREAVRLPAGPAADDTIARLREHLANDLDTPRALAALDAWADEALRGGGHGSGGDEDAPTAIRTAVDALLGVAL
ncbi:MULTISPECIES: cysteine--1-D-myo-inosityl 2-amino-2-deoxy-alpha-D-glucopyranoside ligase [Prauserella salsuginis group]|uniref:L-cysteine:1D-myo-inositol 2-amino-2-deoxy-alpha-D-glucopyranoside ligase n=2 Tax=Prauserella salsuginis group TaxID=2893672 RepID=A0A839Y2V0_9PSEU|nr:MULTISPECIES: cysteine--1-D-myo-inosityl 2-amino-2-deoxy-alpha-D-glucopyranoside ligase [Prauserella salsuginis group]MBB3666245.1 L-cysteine:1D-myo-inositol 2-amino-2-deoxy-alpha-D-glucopyranoside ligase [Prauserella sediminis]MCR3718234.1 L-cysteine:1D-myo-inositol 2-amino-2-deoxy-alpha-D-glucopyranoside ligase [Prauserella flava]MCR3732804.1 L-cysteine:1D-myo-inositol 2-amino-2-deoxy-alpha-D-glucopyranoside ligase [Prauserella salsuginis]